MIYLVGQDTWRTTRPDNARGNKMDPQRKDAIKKAKTKMGRQSSLEMLGLINREELDNDREA